MAGMLMGGLTRSIVVVSGSGFLGHILLGGGGGSHSIVPCDGFRLTTGEGPCRPCQRSTSKPCSKREWPKGRSKGVISWNLLSLFSWLSALCGCGVVHVGLASIVGEDDALQRFSLGSENGWGYLIPYK